MFNGKKMLVSALAAAMLCATAVPAFAADPSMVVKGTYSADAGAKPVVSRCIDSGRTRDALPRGCRSIPRLDCAYRTRTFCFRTQRQGRVSFRPQRHRPLSLRFVQS